MRRRLTTRWGLWISALILLQNCEDKQTELAWDRALFQIGSQSSPRAADLNSDGVLDIVMGAGKAELADVDQGVFALDGRTGEILWTQKADAQMVGSATFLDVNADGVPDVFIGGRRHNLKALDGRTGTVIWSYEYRYAEDPILQYARYNFYNSTLVPDQDGDGLSDLLTVNGGNWNAAPDSTKDRYPGVLMVLNTKTGNVIAADTMPDGQESYMSPLCFRQPGQESPSILFGTGGETLSGRLYLATLQDLMNRNLVNAKVIASEEGHGFIAPPALADLNGDRYYDVIAVSHAGSVTAIDGQDQKVLWQQFNPGMESSNAPAIGFFNRGKIPDAMVVLCQGKWPKYTRTKKLVLDGENGEVIYTDSSSCFELSSPVVYDLNYDGYDEAIFSRNEYDCQEPFSEDNPAPGKIVNQLVALDIHQSRLQTIDHSADFKNIYSTPWIGDLDNDGYLDLVYCQYINTKKGFSMFLGMRVRRISSHIKVRKEPKWGQYMGASGKGVFPL